MTGEYRWSFGFWQVRMIPSGTTVITPADNTGQGEIIDVEIDGEYSANGYPYGWWGATAKITLDINSDLGATSTLAGQIADPWTTQVVNVTATAPESNYNITFTHGNYWEISYSGDVVFAGCQTTGIEGGFEGSKITIELDCIYKVIAQAISAEHLQPFWTEADEAPTLGDWRGESRTDNWTEYCGEKNTSTGAYFVNNRLTNHHWFCDFSDFSTWLNAISTTMYRYIIRSASGTFNVLDWDILPIFYEQSYDTTGAVGGTIPNRKLYVTAADKAIASKATATRIHTGFLHAFRENYANVFDFIVDLCEQCVVRGYADYDGVTRGFGYYLLQNSANTLHNNDIDSALFKVEFLDISIKPSANVVNEVQAAPADKPADCINKFTRIKNQGTRNSKKLNVNIALTNLPVIEKKGIVNPTFIQYSNNFCIYYLNTVRGSYYRVHEKCLILLGNLEDSDDYQTDYPVEIIDASKVSTAENPSQSFQIATRSGWPKIVADTLLSKYGSIRQTEIEVDIRETSHAKDIIRGHSKFSLDIDDYNQTGHAGLYTSYPTTYFITEASLKIEKDNVSLEAKLLG